jgi:hypothetical protein
MTFWYVPTETVTTLEDFEGSFSFSGWNGFLDNDSAVSTANPYEGSQHARTQGGFDNGSGIPNSALDDTAPSASGEVAEGWFAEVDSGPVILFGIGPGDDEDDARVAAIMDIANGDLEAGTLTGGSFTSDATDTSVSYPTGGTYWKAQIGYDGECKVIDDGGNTLGSATATPETNHSVNGLVCWKWNDSSDFDYDLWQKVA